MPSATSRLDLLQKGTPVTINLPDSLRELIAYAFPDYLDEDAVRHSDESWTVVVLDLDYRYRTFRANLSLDDRWTLCPVSGCDEVIAPELSGMETQWTRSREQPTTVKNWTPS